MNDKCGISSFNGKINEVPGICIDNFNNTGYRAYFLSHCHSDHTEGLFNNLFYEFLIKNNVCIYMSDITADLVTAGCNNLKNYIKRLKIGTSHITLPNLFGFEELHISISVIPAGHCFGSVMFLFESSVNKVLYTGDFRITENDVSKLGPLHNKYGKPLNLDVIYVDTTFIDEKYLCFPKRATCVDKLLDIIKEWLEKDPMNAVALNMPAKIGYEYLYNSIYNTLKLKVFVSCERYKFYRNYSDIVGVTNNEDETKIHVCVYTRECKSHELCIVRHKENNFLTIRLTAMKWTDFDIEESPIQRQSVDKVYACFPTHCSRSELIYFVNYFSPKRVIGFPNEYIETRTNSYRVNNEDISVVKAVKRKASGEIKKQNKVPAQILKEMFKI